MLRWLLLLCGAAALWSVDGQIAWAQAASDWPPLEGAFSRGPGYYLSIWKIASCWLLFALWVRTTDWVSQASLNHGLNHILWNCAVFFSFLVAFILVWLIPWFWAGFLLLVTAYAVPLTLFVREHNKQVLLGDRVLTKQHCRRWLAAQAARVGIKLAGDAPGVDEIGPNVQFKAMGAASDRDNNVNLLSARQSPGYVPAKKWFADALGRGANGILLDFGPQLVSVRHQIDGVWQEAPPQERLEADTALTAIKTMAALKVNERRARQNGDLGVETDGAKFVCKITSVGTSNGERVLLELEGKKLKFQSFEELGMRPKMIEQVQELLGRKSGFFLVCSAPINGLTTTFDVLLNSTDRFTRNFVTVEAADGGERETLNVTSTTFDSAAGETPATVLPKLIRTYPDVIVVRDLIDLETITILCAQVKENRYVISSVHARDAVEALLRVLLYKIPPAEFASVVTAVLNSRLLRKLCEKCKEAYPPPPEALRQLGLPAGKIKAFYRPPTQPIDPKHPEKKCDACHGLGYSGRTAIFELLVLDEVLRGMLAKQPKLETLRDMARKVRHRGLQEEGLLLVARGITSLQEVLRVLKL